MDKTRVLFAAPVPPPYGGVANWMLLMQRYIDQRDDVELVGILNTGPKQRSLDGRSLWERVVGQGMEMLRLAKELKELLKKTKTDVIHITTSAQLAVIRDILFLNICKKRNIRSVYHLHFGRTAEIAQANTLEWKLLKNAIKMSSATVAIDGTTEKALQQYFSEKALMIPNPFDLKSLDCISATESQNEVMFLGWCIKTKGVEELLEAWSRVLTQYSDWKLRIVGPYKDAYLDELRNRFSFENVFFDGEKQHDEAMKLMSKTGIFILPSYTEGFPNVILEAMALGKPIIATDVGAIGEMLSEESGVVIPPQDVDAIEQALLTLMSNDAQRRTLANNANERIRREYGIDKVFEQYKMIWRGTR